MDSRLRDLTALHYLAGKDPDASARFERWCDVVAQGEMELFAERLALDGLDVDDARRILSSESGPAAPPPWLRSLKDALSDVKAAVVADRGPLGSEAPLPFEEAYSPFGVFWVSCRFRGSFSGAVMGTGRRG